MTAKRVLDLVTGCAGLLILAPVLAAIAVLIKVGDGGPVLFRQSRVGRAGRPFEMFKFRTMRARAEHDGLLTVGNDPRVTSIGRMLRKYKLDELPQLWNVVRGDMSLVGPRPEVPSFVALYTPEQRRVLDLTPGITDPASIRFTHESELLERAVDPERAYVHVIMPEKIRMNLEYAEKSNLRSDIGQILMTFLRIFGRKEQAFP